MVLWKCCISCFSPVRCLTILCDFLPSVMTCFTWYYYVIKCDLPSIGIDQNCWKVVPFYSMTIHNPIAIMMCKSCCRWKVLTHTPYSPVLFPCAAFLFVQCKCHFRSTIWICRWHLSTDTCSAAIDHFHHRWENCSTLWWFNWIGDRCKSVVMSCLLIHCVCSVYWSHTRNFWNAPHKTDHYEEMGKINLLICLYFRIVPKNFNWRSKNIIFHKITTVNEDVIIFKKVL